MSVLSVQCTVSFHRKFFSKGNFWMDVPQTNKIVKYAMKPMHMKYNSAQFRSRRGLVGSVLAYKAKSQDSNPRSDIKTKYEKYFFSDFLSADFWQKLWASNTIAMKSFSNLSFGVDFKL